MTHSGAPPRRFQSRLGGSTRSRVAVCHVYCGRVWIHEWSQPCRWALCEWHRWPSVNETCVCVCRPVMFQKEKQPAFEKRPPVVLSFPVLCFRGKVTLEVTQSLRLCCDADVKEGWHQIRTSILKAEPICIVQLTLIWRRRVAESAQSTGNKYTLLITKFAL